MHNSLTFVQLKQFFSSHIFKKSLQCVTISTDLFIFIFLRNSYVYQQSSHIDFLKSIKKLEFFFKTNMQDF